MPELTVNLHVHLHLPHAALHFLKTLVNQGAIMPAELDALTAQVKANNDLASSAVTLIQGLSAQIAANKNDPAALQALADSLKASDATLADAISANTPAAAPVAPPTT